MIDLDNKSEKFNSELNESRYHKMLNPWIEGNFKPLVQKTQKFKYSTPNPIAIYAADYFERCYAENVPPYYTELCLELGYYSRTTLDQYMTYSDDFKALIKTIKSIIKTYHFRSLNTNFKVAQWILKTAYRGEFGDEIKQVIEAKEFKIDVTKPNEPNEPTQPTDKNND